eukprot:2471422-Pyramimonas_sp.AAC.1
MRKRMYTHIVMRSFPSYPSRILVSHASKKYRGPDIVTTPCEGVERGNQKVASQTTTTVLLSKATLAKLIPNGQFHVGRSYKLMSEPQHRLEYCWGSSHVAFADGRI